MLLKTLELTFCATPTCTGAGTNISTLTHHAHPPTHERTHPRSFPHGESGADVYDRMTMFEDHLVRDINAGGWMVGAGERGGGWVFGGG